MTHQPELLPDEPSVDAEDRDVERKEYLDRLREHLKDPEFRAIEGFPIGEDEDILALSDPPYYTACPNPFLPEIIERWQEERAELREELGLPDDSEDNGDGELVYLCEPFATDVSEGKHHPIYYAHSYHTKVPHKAVMRYILHYTDPGDVVFDGFCGTGMTGVAAQLCGARGAVRDLGYRVDREGIFSRDGETDQRLGVRKAVLMDLGPAATFLAYNFNAPVDKAAFKQEAKRVLSEMEERFGWMYETWHPDCDDPKRVKARVHYTIWSDVFACPDCGQEIVFWEAAVDQETGRVSRSFPCPSCGAQYSSRTLDPTWETRYDPMLGEVVRERKRVPALINYSLGSSRLEKKPDREDLALIRRIEERSIAEWFPTNRMPEGDESRRNDDAGITHTHHFYTKRNLQAMAGIHSQVEDSPLLLFGFLNTAWHATLMRRYNAHGGDRPLSGTLYVPSLPAEANMFEVYAHKIRQLERFLDARGNADSPFAISTCSSTEIRVPDRVIDYVFVDPPFGSNLMYSELNYIWESWLRVLTNNLQEAIVNQTQEKGLPEYQRLMEECFREFYRVLKPGRWMTVEFHNSKNRVWNSIQEALLRAGFVVADVRTLDKKQGSFKQYTSTAIAKQDLVISAYKPRSGFDDRFLEQAGTAEGAWDFVRQHLAQLPVVVRTDGQLETLSERQDYLLFDRMVAFHIQRGATVPLSAAEFYQGLRRRFVQRDGMFFLPDQAPEYDRARLEAESVAQLSLFVDDEKSAIQWLRQQLDPKAGGEPQTYQEIQPQFLQQLHQARHEELPELSEILEQNFLKDDQDRWYVPDPNKASDLEELRRKALLREFREYLDGKGQLRKFRTEAVRAGFADAWQRKDYETIVQVAERLPERVLQEDADLLMYYDNASLRVDT